MDGAPRQVIRRKVMIRMPFVDLTGCRSKIYQVSWSDSRKTDAGRVFDVENPPLLRIKLLRVAADRHILLVTMHHMITDQWSMGLFRKELALCYAAITRGVPLPLPDLPIQFSDFTRWQRKILADGLLDGQISYWRGQLDAPAPRLVFRRPVIRAQPARFHQQAAQALEIGEALLTRIKHFAGERHCTPFMVFVAALNILLHRLTGETDIRIGTLTANRSQPGTEGVIGYFVNALILRTTVDPQLQCRELLKAVRRICLSAFAHQDVPFEYLESVLERKLTPPSAPWYQVMLNYRNLSAAPESSNGLTISPWYGKKRAADPGIAIARLDLDFHLRELPTKVTGVVSYKTDLFRDRDIAKILDGFAAILDQMIADADRRISKFKLN